MVIMVIAIFLYLFLKLLLKIAVYFYESKYFLYYKLPSFVIDGMTIKNRRAILLSCFEYKFWNITLKGP